MRCEGDRSREGDTSSNVTIDLVPPMKALLRWLTGSRQWRGLALGACWFMSAGGVIAEDQNGSKAVGEYQQGRSLFDAGQYADAASHFANAFAATPSSLYAQWLGRAYGLEAQNASLLARPGLAIRSRDALERAVAMDPDNVGARSDLAAYYQAAPGFLGGGLEKARAQVAEIAKRDPCLGQVRAGDLLWDDGNQTGAEQAYLHAERIDARRPEAHERLGSVYVELHRYPQAFAQWDAMLQADHDQPRALYGLGETASASGDRTAEGEAALKRFFAVVKPDPDGPSVARAHYYLGRLLERRGGPEARAEYEAALRLNPGMRDARRAIDGLAK